MHRSQRCGQLFVLRRHDWRLEIRNWRLRIRNWRLRSSYCTLTLLLRCAITLLLCCTLTLYYVVCLFDVDVKPTHSPPRSSGGNASLYGNASLSRPGSTSNRFGRFGRTGAKLSPDESQIFAFCRENRRIGSSSDDAQEETKWMMTDNQETPLASSLGSVSPAEVALLKPRRYSHHRRTASFMTYHYPCRVYFFSHRP